MVNGGVPIALSAANLRVELRRAGIANAAIDAVWPQWWSAEAEASLSATAELTFTVARRLGLAPRELLDGEARFVWRDETKYKHLGTDVTDEEAALSAFGHAVARAAMGGVERTEQPRFSAVEIRAAILRDAPVVDAGSLLVMAWSLAIPVLYLRVFPLRQKRMHAMSVAAGEQPAILLARDTTYVAPMAYTVAHEIGHIMLGHLDRGGAVVEFEDPLEAEQTTDPEEAAADRYALELLTGRPDIEVATSARTFSARQLADAVTTAGAQQRIDPGVLAMCAGHATGRWQQAYGALQILPPGRQNVPAEVNALAQAQLDWPSLHLDARQYLAAVLGLTADA